MNDFAIIAGSIESRVNVHRLFAIFKNESISVDKVGGDLNLGGASGLRVEFNKGINQFRSQGGRRADVLAQAKAIASTLAKNEIDYFIEVCDDDWKEIISFGDYGRH